jgi:twitching motility two-component system response regulator PilH
MTHVLVIEDSSFQRKIISAVLRENGYDVTLATNGKEGLGLAESALPDLIISDLLMPEIDGFQVLETLRQKKKTIPVIILTSDIQKTTKSRCESLGAAAVLNKPVNREDVLAAVKGALRGP